MKVDKELLEMLIEEALVELPEDSSPANTAKDLAHRIGRFLKLEFTSQPKFITIDTAKELLNIPLGEDETPAARLALLSELLMIGS